MIKFTAAELWCFQWRLATHLWNLPAVVKSPIIQYHSSLAYQKVNAISRNYLYQRMAHVHFIQKKHDTATSFASFDASLASLVWYFFHFGTSLWKSISNLNWVAKTSGNFFGGQNEGTKFWPNVLTGYIFLFYWHILQVPGFWTITIYMVDSFKSIMNWIHPCKLLPLACTVGPKNTCRFSSGVYWLQTFPGEFEILGVTISLSDKESLLDKTSWPVRHVLSFIPKLFVSYTIYIYIYIHITILK